MSKIYFILLIIALGLFVACTREGGIAPINCEKYGCTNVEVTEVLKDVEAKIIRIGDKFCFTIDSNDFAIEGYSISEENILAPCQDLAAEFMVINKRVIISGQKTTCIRILTLPQFRVGFGTVFKLTNIKAK
jgi:hypothetical protein